LFLLVSKPKVGLTSLSMINGAITSDRIVCCGS
jgi:hypothetical protein